MNNAKHTPGPWVYEYRTGDHPGNTRNGWGCNGLWGADNSLVLGEKTGWDGGFEEPSDADARLMAASPAMLEALRRLTDWAEALRASGDAGNWEWSEGDEYSEAMAAIAQAEGV